MQWDDGVGEEEDAKLLNSVNTDIVDTRHPDLVNDTGMDESEAAACGAD